MTNTISRMFDRSDGDMRLKQDLVRNVVLFCGAAFAFQRYGHKLAV